MAIERRTYIEVFFEESRRGVVVWLFSGNRVYDGGAVMMIFTDVSLGNQVNSYRYWFSAQNKLVFSACKAVITVFLLWMKRDLSILLR